MAPERPRFVVPSWRTALPLALGVVVIAAAVGFGVKWMGVYRDAREAERRAAFDENARQIASVVASRFHPYRRALDDLASTPEARRAAREPQLKDAFVAAARPELPPLLTLRVLPVDPKVGTDDAEPPIGYGSVDLMRSAARNDRAVQIEYYRYGEDEPGGYFVVIERIRDEDGELLGFLHLSADAAPIRNELASLAAPGTYVEVVQQTAAGAPYQIVRSGDPADVEGQSARADVPGTTWQITVRAAAEPSGDGPGLPLIGAGAALALLLGLMVLKQRRQGGPKVAEPKDLEIEFAGAIRAIFDGEYPGMDALVRESEVDPERFRLPATDETIEQTDDEVFDLTSDAAAEQAPAYRVHPSVFRTYDIRGIVGETLDEDAVYLIGRALGAMAAELDEKTVIVARDGRNSSEAFAEALTRGLNESGRDVLDIGLTPSPVLYFATHYLDASSGVMITGSHNPGTYNGLKIVLGGRTLSGDDIQEIRRRVEEEDFVEGSGKIDSTEIIPDYIRRISEEIPVSLGDSLSIIVDCGNGVPGIVAPHLFRALGHDVEELYCDVDGDFPNHHPDPSQPENLEDLIACVRGQGADLGLAFDGDGDRLGVVDSEGNVIWPDRQMILFARDVLSRVPGAPIIFDVKCTGRLADAIRDAGGEPVMYKTGHSLIKSKMKELNAPLAGEMSGHIFFKERWYGFDDALYSACRLLEILVNAGRPAAEVFAELPSGVATPELRLDMPETRHAEFMEAVLAAAEFADGTTSTIDGLRVDFPDAWGLIRPSNTTPCLVLRFEGDTEAALARVQSRFRELLLGIDGDLTLPF